jgi:hypothetical protein
MVSWSIENVRPRKLEAMVPSRSCSRLTMAPRLVRFQVTSSSRPLANLVVRSSRRIDPQSTHAPGCSRSLGPEMTKVDDLSMTQGSKEPFNCSYIVPLGSRKSTGPASNDGRSTGGARDRRGKSTLVSVSRDALGAMVSSRLGPQRSPVPWSQALSTPWTGMSLGTRPSEGAWIARCLDR